MTTKELRVSNLSHAREVGGIGEERGGIPIIMLLTAAMVITIMVAIGFLFFNAPAAGGVRLPESASHTGIAIGGLHDR